MERVRIGVLMKEEHAVNQAHETTDALRQRLHDEGIPKLQSVSKGHEIQHHGCKHGDEQQSESPLENAPQEIFVHQE